MPNPAQPQDTDQLLDQACAWVVRLRSDQMSGEDMEQFGEWVTLSNRHRSAFDQMTDLWGDLAIAGELPVNNLPGPEPATSAPGSDIAEWFGWRALAAVAAALVVAVAAILMVVTDTPELTTYRTGVGEHLQITLDDGSKVDINTDSELQVRYSDHRRWLHLVQGEAYFSVARDRQRPFIVELGGASAQALGTQFNIHKIGDSTAEITVIEGTVQVTDADSPSLAKILELDQAITYRANSGLDRVLTVDRTDTIVAWRQRQIVFEDTPLYQVVSTLNRYSATPIELAFRDSGQLAVSGTFSTERPVETARAVAEALALEARVENNRLLLRKTGHRL